MARVSRTARMPAHALAALSLCACNFEVPSSTYLVETKLLSVVVEVVELGPLNPDRVGVASDVPIAEPMPHDRLQFEAFVVDRNGERIPTDELESMWFQCGPFECGEVVIDVETELFDRDCEDLEDDGLPWNMDAVCRLGQGDGEFEFEVPELGQLMAEQRVAQYYGVIAWAGRTAESCWQARRDAKEELDNCGYIQRSVKVGPSWWMLVYAETIGLQSPIPLEKIPAGVYLQAANRVPIVTFPVTIDGELVGTWPEQTKFEVEPGANIRIDSEYDEVAQFLQTYFVAKYSDANFTNDVYFEAASEVPLETPYTSNAIVWIEFDLVTAESPVPPHWDFAVDDYADPGTSRILFVYFDDRFGEGVATLEFEVQS